jgi:adenosylcobinamide-GDP ribazoletransferase
MTDVTAQDATVEGPIRTPLRIALTAVMFLTRIRVPSWVTHAPEDLARSTSYFPLVGVIVGMIGAAAGLLGLYWWNGWVAAIAAVAATVRITGAFHEDALADACDGFGGGWTIEQVLVIMKDSRIGSYGAIGLLLVTVMRVGALAIIATHSPALFVAALIAGHVLGRWSSLPLIAMLRYVSDADTSKSKPFAASVTPPRLIAGSVIALTAITALFGDAIVIATLITLAVVVTFVLGRYFRRRIGGMTGDCLGAANQAVEMTTYLALASAPLLARDVAVWWR